MDYFRNQQNKFGSFSFALPLFSKKNIITSKIIQVKQKQNDFINVEQFEALSINHIDPSQHKYICVPLKQTVINIINNKFNKCGASKKIDNEYHTYFRCNQYWNKTIEKDKKCAAVAIAIKNENIEYKSWALFGYLSPKSIASKSYAKHNHSEKWTLSDAIREWSILQMTFMMSLNTSLKPTRATKEFVLRYPIQAYEFKNIKNQCVKRLYECRASIYGTLLITDADIDYVCTESIYSLTWFSRVIKQ
eukprot:183394_1